MQDENTLKREFASLQKINNNYLKYVLTLKDDTVADNDGIKRVNDWDCLFKKG